MPDSIVTILVGALAGLSGPGERLASGVQLSKSQISMPKDLSRKMS